MPSLRQRIKAHRPRISIGLIAQEIADARGKSITDGQVYRYLSGATPWPGEAVDVLEVVLGRYGLNIDRTELNRLCGMTPDEIMIEESKAAEAAEGTGDDS